MELMFQMETSFFIHTPVPCPRRPEHPGGGPNAVGLKMLFTTARWGYSSRMPSFSKLHIVRHSAGEVYKGFIHDQADAAGFCPLAEARKTSPFGRKKPEGFPGLTRSRVPMSFPEKTHQVVRRVSEIPGSGMEGLHHIRLQPVGVFFKGRVDDSPFSLPGGT